MAGCILQSEEWNQFWYSPNAEQHSLQHLPESSLLSSLKCLSTVAFSWHTSCWPALSVLCMCVCVCARAPIAYAHVLLNHRPHLLLCTHWSHVNPLIHPVQLCNISQFNINFSTFSIRSYLTLRGMCFCFLSRCCLGSYRIFSCL
jgi:hypothetical protein